MFVTHPGTVRDGRSCGGSTRHFSATAPRKLSGCVSYPSDVLTLLRLPGSAWPLPHRRLPHRASTRSMAIRACKLSWCSEEAGHQAFKALSLATCLRPKLFAWVQSPAGDRCKTDAVHAGRLERQLPSGPGARGLVRTLGSCGTTASAPADHASQRGRRHT